MKIAIFAFSRTGCETARRIKGHFDGEEVELYTVQRLLEPGFSVIEKPSRPFYGEIFSRADAMIFVGACGIAVREIAPHVRDKRTDPAVLSVDERAQFVIPLLSGHIGGANDLAKELAADLQAIPVVTTATDINSRFSVDAWAAKNGMHISSMAEAKRVSAEILEHGIPLLCDFPVTSELPSGVIPGEAGETGIVISCEKKQPFAHTLRLVPKVLHLGIGCRRGIAEEAVEEAVRLVLEEHHLDRHAVRCAASIDLKAGEQGLLDFCAKNGWPVSFYTAEELNRVEGEFTPSAFVTKITGVDNVCERAALLGADRLIVKKTAHNGVTVAAAIEKLEVHFG